MQACDRNSSLSQECKRLLFHRTCCREFCRLSEHNPDYFAVDVDKFWPDHFTVTTAYLYPPEFLVTARTLLLVINRLRLSHIVNRDIIAMIMDRAVCPNLYPIQHGLRLSRLRLFNDDICYLCKHHFAYTRFSKDCCYRGYCRTYTGQTCGRNHNLRRNAVGESDCTVYRCVLDRCKTCNGKIRHRKDLQLELCSLEACNFKDEKVLCFCGHDVYKEKSPEGLVNVLPENACLLNKQCGYLLKEKCPQCGENLFNDPESKFRCSKGVCRKNMREYMNQKLFLVKIK